MSTRADREAELFAMFAKERQTVDALHNWGAWARDSTVRRACFSAEGRYRSPKNDDDRMPLVQVDIRQAVAIAKVMAYPVLPARSVFALSAWFILDKRENGFCRYMREHTYPMPVREIEAVVRDAVVLAKARAQPVFRRL